MTGNWVTVGEFDDPGDAEWEAARLREAGIDARVHDPATDPYDPDPAADARVQVAPEDADRARTLLATDGIPDGPAEPDDETDEPDGEPAPGGWSERVEASDLALHTAMIAIVFPPLVLKSAWQIGSAFARPGAVGPGGVFRLGLAALLNLGTVLVWLVLLSYFFQ